MLRQILTMVLLILIPYVLYGIIAIIRRRMANRPTVPDSVGFWNGAPVLVLGLIGCVLAVAVLIAISVIDNDPSKPRYVPPINAERS